MSDPKKKRTDEAGVKNTKPLRFASGDVHTDKRIDEAYRAAVADPLATDLRRWFEEGSGLEPRGPGWAKYKLDPPATMHAWHCGAKPAIASFDDFVKYIGSGEGIRILGPGIYFATSERSARAYCKYAQRPVLYEAEIDTVDFYDSVSGRPARVLERLRAALAEVGLEPGRNAPSDFDYGRHDIGVLVWKLGRAAALQLLLKHRVRGALDWVHTFWEIAVFDPSTITVISAVEQPGVQQNRRTSR